MNAAYRAMLRERMEKGLPPLPLTADQVAGICAWLSEGRRAPPDGDEDLAGLLADRTPAGVDPAAKVKAAFLARTASGGESAGTLDPEWAVRLLGAMQGGYNIPPLLSLLAGGRAGYAGARWTGGEDPGQAAARALSGCILAGDAVDEVGKLHRAGNAAAGSLLEAWASADWFTRAPALPDTIRLVVYKVSGEVNTDDLSPARHASTRPDIPLHALTLGETRFPGGREELARISDGSGQSGWLPVFVADTLGTGSSRKSATNSLVWFLGRDIPHIPNKRRGGVVMAGRIAPIFYNSFEDAGGLPFRLDVSRLASGMRIVAELDSGAGHGVIREEGGRELTSFSFPRALADEWRAGGRINLIIGRKLSERAAAILGRPAPDMFAASSAPAGKPGVGFTLAQKLVGRACGVDGVLPGDMCEPAISTVGSQDTTGPMTRDELNDLACLRFSAPMVMQSFCHTAALPNERDKAMQQSLPVFFRERGGLALKPGDGIIHSWLNRLLVPDCVGTGGDSHTRFPLGISFAAGSGLVALAAAMGFMPVDMPESVLVAFSGGLREGVTLRDVVNAIPLAAIEAGLSDMPGPGGGNVFNGRIMEMEGLCGLTAEDGFELACASAERSAAACTVSLDLEAVTEYVASNVAWIGSLLRDGYQDAAALERRKAELEAWLTAPSLLRRDANAVFAARVDVNLDAIREPVVACPNNPDLVVRLSERAGERIDEVFIGSCMSNIGHFRAAARILSRPGAKAAVKRLWVVPPTRMDRDLLDREGLLDVFSRFGARLEVSGCSLCMGNQARVDDNAAVFSTSTRNFDNRMGTGARVYLGSGVLAAIVATLGRIPAPDEYFALYREAVAPEARALSRPLRFHPR